MLSTNQMRLGYHWTGKESLQAILDSMNWEAGSITTNPNYRFCYDGPADTRRGFCLVFDLSKMKVSAAPKTVPWEEWEVLAETDVDLIDPCGPFLGLAARTSRDIKTIRRMVYDRFEEPDFFELMLVGVKGVKPAPK